MKENLEQEVLTQEVNKETENPTEVIKIEANSQTQLVLTEDDHETTLTIKVVYDNAKQDKSLNPFEFVDLEVTEHFVANLYQSKFWMDSDISKVSNCTILFENAINHLADNETLEFENSIISIIDFLPAYYRKDATEQDSMLIRVIANSVGRHSMDYYLSKAKEYAEKYKTEIAEQKQLINIFDLFDDLQTVN